MNACIFLFFNFTSINLVLQLGYEERGKQKPVYAYKNYLCWNRPKNRRPTKIYFRDDHPQYSKAGNYSMN